MVIFGSGIARSYRQSVVARPKQWTGQTSAYLEPKSALFLKTFLRELSSDTDRGISSARDTRAQIAEAQVRIVGFNSHDVLFSFLWSL